MNSFMSQDIWVIYRMGIERSNVDCYQGHEPCQYFWILAGRGVFRIMNEAETEPCKFLEI
jgi:hypothetical protein